MKTFLLLLVSSFIASSTWATTAIKASVPVPAFLGTLAAGGVVADITFVLPDQTTEYFRYQMKNGKINVLEHSSSTFNMIDLADGIEKNQPLPEPVEMTNDSTRLVQMFTKPAAGTSISVKHGETRDAQSVLYVWSGHKWNKNSNTPGYFDTSEVYLDHNSATYKQIVAHLKELDKGNRNRHAVDPAVVKKFMQETWQAQMAEFENPDVNLKPAPVQERAPTSKKVKAVTPNLATTRDNWPDNWTDNWDDPSLMQKLDVPQGVH